MSLLIIQGAEPETEAWTQACNWADAEGYEISAMRASELNEAALAKSGPEDPQAIVYVGGVSHLPKVVRMVRAVHPNVQLVFPGPEEERTVFADHLRITPSAGSFWRYASLEKNELAPALNDAVRATRQRAQFRKTLSGMNRRIRNARPTQNDYERLAISDWLLANVLRASQDGILVVTPHLRVLEWNPSCERMFGVPRIEAQGRNLMGLISGSDAPIIEACIQSILTTGNSFARELLLRAPSGKTLEIEASFNLVPALQGSSQDYVAIQLRDISQRLKMDRALLAAKDAAESANRTKSEFLANMSHEIRTPMTSILGFSELLEERLEDDVHQQFIRTIKQNGEFLLRIINDILDISKIEADRIEMEHERLNPLELAESVSDMMRVRAEENHQNFELVVTKDAPREAVGDAVRIRQILINLVGNAVKFTPPGGSVQLKVGRVNGFLAYEVSDTGPGIPKESQETIFAPFAQGGQVSRNFGGTGLGLTISRRLARMMHGDVTVASTPGEGSRFTLLIPDVVAKAKSGKSQP